jgi:hypothetical protein
MLRRAMRESSWTAVDPNLPALTYTYSFGPGIAASLAFPIEGGMAVVSPPFQPAEGAFTELEKHGSVKAIIAPNAFHTMGLAAWKARYPEAILYAPAQSIPRAEKQSKLTGIRPIAELFPKLGDKVEIDDMPHYKTGELLVRWKVEGGWAWYMTDVLMNMTKAPKGMFGLVFRWTKSAPGFRRNALAGAFMVKDKKALYGWLVAQAEKTPPKLVVMCHGDNVRPADPVAEIRAAVT